MNSLSTVRGWLATAPPPVVVFSPIVRGLAGPLLVAALFNSPKTPSQKLGLAGPLLVAALAGCSHPPEATAATPAATPTLALVVSKPSQAARSPAARGGSRAGPRRARHPHPGRPDAWRERGRPLIGATVLLRGSPKGPSTDATGSYSLEVPAGENTFVVGYGGYQNGTAVGRDAQPLTVTLLPTPGSRAKGRRGRQ